MVHRLQPWWKYRLTPARFRPLTYGVLAMFLSSAGFVLFPVYACACGQSKKSVDISNLKQLVLADLMYRSDYDDRHPLQLSTSIRAKPALDPYVKDDKIFFSTLPEQPPYWGNQWLAGTDMPPKKDIETTMIFFDPDDLPNGRRNAAFADGHVKTLPSDVVADAFFTRRCVVVPSHESGQKT